MLIVVVACFGLGLLLIVVELGLFGCRDFGLAVLLWFGLSDCRIALWVSLNSVVMS